jgi:hypothetical protein
MDIHSTISVFLTEVELACCSLLRGDMGYQLNVTMYLIKFDGWPFEVAP